MVAPPIFADFMVTVNVEGLVGFLLGWWPLDDDDQTVIGDSRVAFLAKSDIGMVFMPAAEWHDAAYVKDSHEQKMGMTRANVDKLFLHKMLQLADGNYDLECRALTLYLLVRKYAEEYWEGV